MERELFQITRMFTVQCWCKVDGTVFFVTIDGRFELENIPGMDYEQLSYLMLYFGAETAINVDGGGSSTMLFYNPETDYYDTMNRPSDNPLSLRSVANGMSSYMET